MPGVPECIFSGHRQEAFRGCFRNSPALASSNYCYPRVNACPSVIRAFPESPAMPDKFPLSSVFALELLITGLILLSFASQ